MVTWRGKDDSGIFGKGRGNLTMLERFDLGSTSINIKPFWSYVPFLHAWLPGVPFSTSDSLPHCLEEDQYAAKHSSGCPPRRLETATSLSNISLTVNQEVLRDLTLLEQAYQGDNNYLPSLPCSRNLQAWRHQVKCRDSLACLTRT
ncbi:hypothetical protein VNO77_19653 [Canavalia gladiata]|uniref:Uncharacterized protein n=1 Tax=Canavalia gladiata TaxID=3824 RepID=A0AAN9LN39_CANGL